jgi:hypothetical protein
MYSILHITDLHRANSDPISNSELLSALISDRERYEREAPPIRSPDAIVVSGDIIQGVTLNQADFAQELEMQYDIAHDFIVSLADRFLGGDRTKVIIVPGNHDIDWNVAFSSMEPVNENELPQNLPSALFEPDSPFRWDWKSRCLYKIKNHELYRQRLAAYWRFFERFYGDFEGMLQVAKWSDTNLYSLDNGRIGVAAFNSCVGNDCFAFHGEILREAVAKAHLDLKDLGPWRLRIAVWHHDIEGPPHRADYMDLDIVRGMIGRGFRLGLYGHQHRVQITPHHAYLLDQETMVVASAGSLCAGRRELPTGAVRGYSIIEIRDDYRSARVHVREMRFANLFSRAALHDFEGRSYVDLEWTVPLDAAGRPEEPLEEKRVSVLRSAEDALHGRNDPAEALRLLSNFDVIGDAFGRRLALDAAIAHGDPLKLIEVVLEPRTIEELVLLVGAHIDAGSSEMASYTIAKYASRLSMPEPLKSELEERIELMKWKNS